MAFDVEGIKRDVPLSSVAGKHVEKLAQDGDEWRGLCPFHKEKTPSFTIYKGDRRGHCFGCGWDGDVIAFTADLHHVSFTEACAILGGERAAPATVPPKEELRETKSLYAMLRPQPMVEADLPLPERPLRAWNPKRSRWTTYHPSMVFPYRSRDGTILGCVVRIDLGAGKKLTPTLRMVARPEHEAPHWSHMPFDSPRPLYGLDHLDRDGQVIIVEGEKAADAARRLLGALILTWPGGGKSISKVDWSPLAGRSCVLWGDADEEGWRTVAGWEDNSRTRHPGIAELLTKAGAGPIKIIPWDRDRPEGWDAADAEAAGMSRGDVIAWMKSRVVLWSERERQPAPWGNGKGNGPSAPISDETPPAGVLDEVSAYPVEAHRQANRGDQPRAVDDGNEPDAGGPFRVLGYNRNTFFYLPNGTQQIVELSAAQHTPANLLLLAPVDWWEREFPSESSKQKFDTAYASNALLRRAERVGIFEPDRLRGRGAWIDDGRPVMHLGSSVYIGADEHRPTKAPSRYIYEAAPPLHIGRAQPATTAEAHRLVEVSDRLSWENPLSSQLFAGWLVIAPICGALKWRPHIWVCGPASSGKTTAIDKVAIGTVGAVAVRRDGSTTEAHLRQVLFHDARPVIIDEAESEDKAAAAKMQQVLLLSRISSSGGTIGKGGQDGQAIDYTVRACFCFSSINTSVTHYADETRISKLVLKRPTGVDVAERFDALNRDIEQWLTEEWAAKMFARSVEHLPTLLANAKTFTAAAATVLRSARAADQIGTLIAGLFLCHSTKAVSYDDAVHWIKARRWEEHTAIDAANDERRLLTRIMLSTRRTATRKSGPADFSIGELVEIIAAPYESDDAPVRTEEAVRVLGRVGILVEGLGDEATIIIANRSPAMSEILSGTPWAAEWHRPLRMLAGAEPMKPKYFSPGMTERGTAIPISVLTGRNPPSERPAEAGAAKAAGD